MFRFKIMKLSFYRAASSIILIDYKYNTHNFHI